MTGTNDAATRRVRQRGTRTVRTELDRKRGKIVTAYRVPGSGIKVAVNDRGMVGIGLAELDEADERYYPVEPGALMQVLEQARVDSRDIAKARYPDEPASPSARKPLEWHEGTHPWAEHDGYRRHQHSLNGALTIDQHDTRAHFAHGPEFENP